jgi:hypothetical protein
VVPERQGSFVGLLNAGRPSALEETPTKEVEAKRGPGLHHCSSSDELPIGASRLERSRPRQNKYLTLDGGSPPVGCTNRCQSGGPRGPGKHRHGIVVTGGILLSCRTGRNRQEASQRGVRVPLEVL